MSSKHEDPILAVGETLRRELQPLGFTLGPHKIDHPFGPGWLAVRRSDNCDVFVKLLREADAGRPEGIKHALFCRHPALVTPCETIPVFGLGTVFIFELQDGGCRSLRAILEEIPTMSEDIAGALFAPIALGVYHLEANQTWPLRGRLDAATVAGFPDGTVRLMNPLLSLHGDEPTKDQRHIHKHLDSQHKTLTKRQSELEKHRVKLMKKHRKLEKKFDRLEDKDRKLTEKHHSLDEKHARLEREYEQLEQEHHNVNARHVSIPDIRAQGCLTERGTGSIRTDPSRKSLRQLEKDNERVEQHHEHIERHHAALVKHHERLQESYAKLEHHHKKLDDHHREVGHNQAEMHALYRQLDHDLVTQREVQQRFIVADLGMLLYEICTRQTLQKVSKKSIRTAHNLSKTGAFSFEFAELVADMLSAGKNQKNRYVSLHQLLRRPVMQRAIDQLEEDVRANPRLDYDARGEYLSAIGDQQRFIDAFDPDAIDAPNTLQDDGIDPPSATIVNAHDDAYQHRQRAATGSGGGRFGSEGDSVRRRQLAVPLVEQRPERPQPAIMMAQGSKQPREELIKDDTPEASLSLGGQRALSPQGPGGAKRQGTPREESEREALPRRSPIFQKVRSPIAAESRPQVSPAALRAEAEETQPVRGASDQKLQQDRQLAKRGGFVGQQQQQQQDQHHDGDMTQFREELSSGAAVVPFADREQQQQQQQQEYNRHEGRRSSRRHHDDESDSSVTTDTSSADDTSSTETSSDSSGAAGRHRRASNRGPALEDAQRGDQIRDRDSSSRKEAWRGGDKEDEAFESRPKVKRSPLPQRQPQSGRPDSFPVDDDAEHDGRGYHHQRPLRSPEPSARRGQSDQPQRQYRSAYSYQGDPQRAGKVDRDYGRPRSSPQPTRHSGDADGTGSPAPGGYQLQLRMPSPQKHTESKSRSPAPYRG